MLQPSIIKRENIPGITEMLVEGEMTGLGVVKNFKNNQLLKNHLPEDLCIAWTRLKSGEELNPHYHPCESVVIVTKGEGQSLGDTESDISGGDIVFIPAWNNHGFLGKGDEGFWALSIQFQKTAIFETETDPLTTYRENQKIPSLEERQLHIIPREKLPLIQEVVKEGKTFDLGEVRNFREDKRLSSILPKNFTSAWVGLTPSQELNPHVHETDSMIIVTEGEGLVTGDLQGEIKEGDLVYVPAGQHHGFIGSGEKGFKALSIQFEDRSLYEKGHEAEVKFVNQAEHVDSLESLHALNQYYRAKFQKSNIFQLLKEDTLRNSAGLSRFLSCLQVMSNYFQKIMFSRVANCDDEEFRKVYYEHFLEEIGHDIALKKERDNKEPIWDPVLEGCASWFVNKNNSLDNTGSIVLVQMALEGGAHIFYESFEDLMKEVRGSAHFTKHVEADEGHENLGLDLLENLNSKEYQKLAKILVQTWEMLICFLDRTYSISKAIH